jgi:beta-glucosidase
MTTFDDAVRAVQGGRPTTEVAGELYSALTDDERLWLLDGDTECWEGLARFRIEGYNTAPIVHGQVERVGLPGTRFVDGPRGCVAGNATAFPVSMARGATWDVDLEEQVGDVIGREIRALGGNFFGGVCINLPRHPAWGRAQETYGDDPHHLGEFGAALIRGTQHWVMACAKHYGLNSMENARFVVDVTADEATLHDVYLPHFKRVVDEGVAAIMGAYNSVNGEWCGQNTYLLTTVLRDMWGWEGITVTDFIFGLRDAAASLNAGMDLEEPFRQQRAERLTGQLEAGETSWDMVERAAVRLIAAQLRGYASRTETDPPVGVVANAEARALARTVAARAMVLLKNDPVDGRAVLPLDPGSLRSIALVGRLAGAANMGDHGSSDVRPPSSVSPYEGLRAAFPEVEIRLVQSDDVDEARRAAAESDVAIVVAGYTAADEGEFIGPDSGMTAELLTLFPPIPQSAAALLGEAFAPENEDRGTGGDRVSLALRALDEDLIRAVAAANPRTVVAIVAAGAVLTESWREGVPAVVMMWYAGMEGGHALADVLRGAQNPSGRLPFSIPTSEAHLPSFDREATAITYDHFHGQRLLDRLGVNAAFPHGYGLSYTRYEVRSAEVRSTEDGSRVVSVEVANKGPRDGTHVVQIYGRSSSGPYAGELTLVGFAPVSVDAGATATVEVEVSLLPLGAWDPGGRRRILPAAADVELEVGAHAHDLAATLLRLEP